MKNKLTLSELRNVIKEEIQFQLTKKQLFENLDRKTLSRILKEENEGTMTTTTIQIKNLQFFFPENGLSIVSIGENDTFTAIPDNSITENKNSLVNIVFTISLPLRLKDNTQYIETLKTDLRKSIVIPNTQGQPPMIQLKYVPFMKIPSTDEKIEVVKADIIVKYPSGMKQLATVDKIFNLDKFKGIQANIN